MRMRVGTSGFSYKEWKGSFYPRALPATKMLRFYSERFDAVEINNTFYRMPSADVLRAWAEDARPGFSFALKAPVYLAHVQKGAALADPLARFLDAAASLGATLGPIYLQLPPTMQKDVAGLETLLRLVPRAIRIALEPGAPSWMDDDVLALLRERAVALCAIDDGKRDVPIVPTTDFGYVRLRRARYTKAALAAWAARIRAQPWSETWVFFKHDDEATGPRLASRFKAVVEGG